jgi:hypothetical protein
VEGAGYFGNSERAPIIAGVTKTQFALTGHQAAIANIPQVNVLVDTKYKVCALINSGSTTTLLSTGMLDKMPNMKRKMKPTSLGFYGVGEKKIEYAEIIYKIDL